MTVQELKNRFLKVQDKLFRLSKRILGNSHEAEDAVQEVFIKLWKNKNLDKYKNIEGVAMTVAKNYCIDKIRLRKDFSDKIENLTTQNAKTPEQELETNEKLAQINLIINKLPLQQKIVMQLRDIEQYSFEEISKITEQNIAALRTNLSRARKKVRTELIKIENYGLTGN